MVHFHFASCLWHQSRDHKTKDIKGTQSQPKQSSVVLYFSKLIKLKKKHNILSLSSPPPSPAEYSTAAPAAIIPDVLLKGEKMLIGK